MSWPVEKTPVKAELFTKAVGLAEENQRELGSKINEGFRCYLEQKRLKASEGLCST